MEIPEGNLSRSGHLAHDNADVRVIEVAEKKVVVTGRSGLPGNGGSRFRSFLPSAAADPGHR